MAARKDVYAAIHVNENNALELSSPRPSDDYFDRTTGFVQFYARTLLANSVVSADGLTLKFIFAAPKPKTKFKQWIPISDAMMMTPSGPLTLHEFKISDGDKLYRISFMPARDMRNSAWHTSIRMATKPAEFMAHELLYKSPEFFQENQL